MKLANVVWIALLSTLLLATPAHADERVDRLVALGKVWGKAKFFHPALATREIDWDAAAVKAIAKVREAKTDDEAAAACAEMLAILGDPLTRVDPAAPAAAEAAAERPKALHRKEKDVLVVDLTLLAKVRDLDQLAPLVDAVDAELETARAVVFDLRISAAQHILVEHLLARWLPPLLPPGTRGPSMRLVRHHGYASQNPDFTGSGGYYSAMETIPGEPLFARASKRPPEDARVVFLVNEHAVLGGEVFAMQRSGRGFVVAQGGAVYADGDFAPVPLPGDRLAWVRTSEWIEAPFGADVTLPARTNGLPKALALAAPPKTAKGAKAVQRKPKTRSLASPAFSRDDRYETMTDPAVEWRLLALFRVWNVIDLFYPYLELIDPWDPVLAELIPRFEAAANGKDYVKALAELSTRIADNHVWLQGPAIDELFGAGFADAEIRWIEGQPVVTRVGDELAKAGLAVGDVILAVDGEMAQARLERLTAISPGSHAESRRGRVLGAFLRGPVGDGVVSARDAKGKLKAVRFARSATRPPRPAGGDAYKVLGKEVGYVDLRVLTVDQVPAMFEAMKGTKAIVFDMRGYPNRTLWSITPRINTRKATTGALFHRPQPNPYEAGNRITTEIRQPIQSTEDWIYTGRTVMLIDDRTISQAEHTGLFFEAASGTTFIGTPSAGANGDVTFLALPGGLWMSFTGQAVSHADGRQLQRLGLQPHVRVEPTLKGIRAGKDEVLDRALDWIRRGK